MIAEPLVFEPILSAKVWGGDRLSRWNKRVRKGDRVGESWEIADLESTSVDGAGGGDAHSIVAVGPLVGRSIADLIAERPHDILGPRGGHRFPLLIKYLDARENLSVQVHPSPEYAATHPEAHLKFESWYILEAEPGAVIYKGMRPGLNRDEFAAHIRDGSVVDDLLTFPARPGDCHHLPSGTVHALGAGVLVAEVQTPSDTTFRVYDWGRTDRALHIEQALRSAILAPPDASDLRRADGSARCALGGTRYYDLAELRVTPGADQELIAAGDAPRVWMAIGGAGVLSCPRGSFEPVSVERGSTVLLPAALRAVRVSAASPMVILEAVPR